MDNYNCSTSVTVNQTVWCSHRVVILHLTSNSSFWMSRKSLSFSVISEKLLATWILFPSGANIPPKKTSHIWLDVQLCFPLSPPKQRSLWDFCHDVWRFSPLLLTSCKRTGTQLHRDHRFSSVDIVSIGAGQRTKADKALTQTSRGQKKKKKKQHTAGHFCQQAALKPWARNHSVAAFATSGD